MKLMIAIFALFISFSSLSFASEVTAEVDKAAPNFTLTDSQGKSHKLSDFKGKIVVLEWVNFECPYVVKHYKSENMQELQKKYTDKGVIWLSVCSSAEGKQGHYPNNEVNEKIKERKGKATAYLVDSEGTVGKMYGAKATPAMYVIDKKGNLVYAGAIDDNNSAKPEDAKTAKNYVAAAIDAAMNGKAVETKSTKAYGCSVKYK